jgi:glycosyltransferase involved in cell wall biosynthesis
MAPTGTRHGAPVWRIALVTETWPPEVNGVALTVARLARGLAARGHDLQLLRPRRDRDDAPREAGMEEPLLPGLPIPRYSELRMGLPARRRLRALWRETRPDIVHIATEGPLGWSALRAARELGIPVSSEFRTNFHMYSAHYGIGWLQPTVTRYLRWFHNTASVTMVPTEGMRAELAALGFERLCVVGRGVDAERFDPRHRSAALRDLWGAGEHDPVLLCVGRLAAEKNLDLLLDAWRAAKASMPTARLVLVGDGPMRAQLEQQHPDVIFAGQRTGEDLAAHYASADLFVFPSLSETWGNVVTEAMASGLPVIAWNRAAAAELLRTGENGALLECGDLTGFRDAVLRLAQDPLALRRMGASARASALDVGWDGIVAAVEDRMRASLSGPQRLQAEAPESGMAPA